VRLWKGAEGYLVPELISEQPLSQLRGLGGAIQNFELQKGGASVPQIYHSRIFVKQTVGLGGNGKPAVTKCADCGASSCSDCQLACCGDSFCGQCYDYHITNTCVRKPVQNVRPLQTFGSSQRSYGGLGSHGDFFVLVFFRLVQSVSLIFLCSTNESAFHWIVTFHDRSWAAKYTLNVRQYRCFDVKQYPMCGVVVRA
jgi:hypothetical protein